MKTTKKTNFFYDTLTLFLFIICAFTVWEAVYEIMNMAGSVACGCPGQAVIELKRMAPLLMTALCELGMGVTCFNAFRFLDREKRAGAWRSAGIWSIFWGAAITVYVIVQLAAGVYDRLFEGFITPLFPGDMILGGILFIVYGVFSFRYSREKQVFRTVDPIDGRFRIFHILLYAVTEASFAAVCYGFFILDWKHGAEFFNIMLMINYALPVIMAAVYRFGFAKQPSKRRKRFAKKAGLLFLVMNILLFAAYLASVEMYNEAPCQNALGLLPIEFTASFNAFALIYGICNIFPPLAAFIWGRKAEG